MEVVVILLAVVSSMKFLSTWLRNASPDKAVCLNPSILNEVPEHMAQELPSFNRFLRVTLYGPQ